MAREVISPSSSRTDGLAPLSTCSFSLAARKNRINSARARGAKPKVMTIHPISGTTHLLPLDPSPAASAVVVAPVRHKFYSFQRWSFIGAAD